MQMEQKWKYSFILIGYALPYYIGRILCTEPLCYSILSNIGGEVKSSINQSLQTFVIYDIYVTGSARISYVNAFFEFHFITFSLSR